MTVNQQAAIDVPDSATVVPIGAGSLDDAAIVRESIRRAANDSDRAVATGINACRYEEMMADVPRTDTDGAVDDGYYIRYRGAVYLVSTIDEQ